MAHHQPQRIWNRNPPRVHLPATPDQTIQPHFPLKPKQQGEKVRGPGPSSGGAELLEWLIGKGPSWPRPPGPVSCMRTAVCDPGKTWRKVGGREGDGEVGDRSWSRGQETGTGKQLGTLVKAGDEPEGPSCREGLRGESCSPVWPYGK